MLFLLEGQSGEACDLAAKQCSFVHRRALDRDVLSLYPNRVLPLSGEKAASLTFTNTSIPGYHRQATNTTPTHITHLLVSVPS